MAEAEEAVFPLRLILQRLATKKLHLDFRDVAISECHDLIKRLQQVHDYLLKSKGLGRKRKLMLMKQFKP